MPKETVSISDEDSAAIGRLSEALGRPREELLREAIRDYLGVHSRADDWRARMRQAFGIWADRNDEEIERLDREFREDLERRLPK